jgi:hypothetical protein
MTLPTSGPLALSAIKTEFNGTRPISLSQYYKGGSFVSSYADAPNVPASGTIKNSEFYGATNVPPQTVTWITPAGQNLTQGTPFNLQLSATNAVSYMVSSGSLPNSVSMTTTGLITGTPSTVQTTHPVITATSVSNSTPQTFTFSVVAPPPPPVVWNTAPGQSLTQGSGFGLQLSATNAVIYTITSGSLPTGLSMTAGGLISGTASTTQTTYPVITATSAAGVATPQTFTFTVSAAPSYNEIVTGPTSVNGGQGFTVTVSGGVPNTGGTWQFTSGPGSPGQIYSFTLDGAGGGVFPNVVLQVPGFYTYTFNFSATGDVRTFRVVVNYTYTNGYTQEYGWTGTNLTLSQQINEIYYESNSQFTVTYDPVNPIRYGLYRRGDSGGVSFWTQDCVINGWTLSSQGLINAIFNAADNDSEAARVLTPNKPYDPGPGYGDFGDRPVP